MGKAEESFDCEVWRKEVRESVWGVINAPTN
ncbi:hypothetical protein A2U01_0103109, partial [Trifolium medium]|nr:hypothetical protein [Trifolium medium]